MDSGWATKPRDAGEELARLLRRLGVAPLRDPEAQALLELRAGHYALDLATILGLAEAAHARYRARGLLGREVRTIWLAHLNGISVLRSPLYSEPKADLDNRRIFAPLNPYPFDIAHETSEIMVGGHATHTDVQLMAIALLLERSEAQRVLHLGLDRGVRALRRFHKRVPPWCIATRLVLQQYAEKSGISEG